MFNCQIWCRCDTESMTQQHCMAAPAQPHLPPPAAFAGRCAGASTRPARCRRSPQCLSCVPPRTLLCHGWRQLSVLEPCPLSSLRRHDNWLSACAGMGPSPTNGCVIVMCR